MAAKAAIVMLLLHSSANAQVYKWVDQQGKTHYSDKKEASGTITVAALAYGVMSTQLSAPGGVPAWQERERAYQLRQQTRLQETSESPARPRRLSTTYGSNQIDTDKAKCELARDVLSGAVRRSNGAVTDGNDRQIAQRDIGSFCR